MTNKKPKVTIKEREDHTDMVVLTVELDPGDNSDIITEKLNFGWQNMQLDATGYPRYKHSLREWARQMIAIRKDKDIKKNGPKKGDIIEVE